MDIKSWFETGTGMKIKEVRWLKTPPFPYNIFIDDSTFRGSDLRNNIVEHNITIEHYNVQINTEEESKIEKFLNSEKEIGKFGNYRKNREWLDEEKMWVTLYEIDTFLEKIRKVKNNNE